MPSTATITAFYVFSPAERPRIGHMNGNFSNFRGHYIPIDPNTAAAAASGQYDLGVAEYRWRTGYMAKLDVSMTSTAAVTLEAVTAGEFHFKKDGVSKVQLTPTGYLGYNVLGGAGYTHSADFLGIALSAGFEGTITATGPIANSTCTLQTNGRPVILCLQSNMSTAASSAIELSSNTVSSGLIATTFSILRADGFIVGTFDFRRSGDNGQTVERYPGEIKCFDFPVAGGTSYYMAVQTLSASVGSASINFKNICLTAVET